MTKEKNQTSTRVIPVATPDIRRTKAVGCRDRHARKTSGMLIREGANRMSHLLEEILEHQRPDPRRIDPSPNEEMEL